MKNIFKIYFADLKKVFTNRVAVVIIIAICILPSLYARFYLKSSRDPYWNTKWLKVAVANNDEWTVFNGEYLNIWNEIIDELKENDAIWRVFVDEDIAQEWTRLWQYYANIVIESWFSQKFITFLDEEPQNPELHYTVNEKINAIVPKITDKWTSTIKENIEKQFIRTVDEVVMSKINELWLFVQNDQKNINDFIDMIHKVRRETANLDEIVASSIDIANRAKNKLQEINGKMPEIYNNIDDWQILLQDVQWLSKDTLSFLDTAPGIIKDDVSDIKSIVKNIDKKTSSVISKMDAWKDVVLSWVDDISQDVVLAQWKVEALLSVLENVKLSLQSVIDVMPWAQILLSPLDKIIEKLENIDDKFDTVNDLSDKIENWINDKTNAVKDDRVKLKSTIADIENDFGDISDELDWNIIPQLKNVLSWLYDMADVWRDKLYNLEWKLPEVQNEINSWVEILDKTIDKLQDFQKDVPKIQWNISKLDNELQSIKKDWLINEFLSVALLDPGRFADFFSSPIELVEHKLFSIPNYWSAMSPFFTVLAIRVWSLLMIAMFTTRVKDSELQKCKDYEKFLGKRLFFLTISIAQWLIVSLWEVILLWVYVENLWAFILTTLVCSIVFSMIAYSCVSTLWNSGKAFMIIFLVLQLSWSGWTFPVEMSDSFFQAINPYLPFTYAIRAMRESVWWVVPQVFYTNLVILLWFFGIFAIAWLLIKPLIAKSVSIFDNKFAESELWEH